MSSEPVRVLPAATTTKSRGSCIVGCIGVMILVCVLLFVGVLAAIYGLGRLKDNLTSTEPMPLPTVEFSPEQASEVQQRVDAFRQTVEGKGGPAVLELTAQDINALLKTAPDAGPFADSVYVDIQEDSLLAQVSMPLDQFPGMAGRYLNGSAKVDLDVVNDQFVLSIREFTMRGKQMPVAMLAQFESEINSNMNKDMQARELAQKIESIAVENGKVRVTLKGAQ